MQNVQTTLEKWGEKITDALKAAIPPQRDRDGMLKQCISFSFNYAGFPIVFELKLADYYKFIDEGRKPGRFPPMDVLKVWIVNKHLTLKPFRTLKKSVKKLNPISTDQKSINQLSFLIGRKIARDGIPATNFYTNTISPDIITELQNNLSIAFKQDVFVMLSQIS